MKSQGFLRGYLAKNLDTYKFITVVANAIRREFNYDVGVKECNDLYIINIDNKYEVEMAKTLVLELKTKSPYAVDRFILEKVIEKGGQIDKKRSQYIEYCFLGTLNKDFTA